MNSEKLLTVDEVAEILQVSPSTVYRRIQAGELPAVKLGHRQIRIKQEDLDAYIDAHRITSTEFTLSPVEGLRAGAGQPAGHEPADGEPDRHDETDVDADPAERRHDTPPAPNPAAGRGAG